MTNGMRKMSKSLASPITSTNIIQGLKVSQQNGPSNSVSPDVQMLPLIVRNSFANAGPSTWQMPPGWAAASAAAEANGFTVPKKQSHSKARTRPKEDEDAIKETANRVALRIETERNAALHPDVDAPFVDSVEVVNRLLPYHVFQQPKEDLDTLTYHGKNKGKRKATEDDLTNEIAETKFALECYRRRQRLLDRLRTVKIKAAKRESPDNQSYLLAQLVLESDRHEVSSAQSSLRSARMELDRIEREKRLETVRQPYYSHHNQQVQYYRAYPYAYVQPPGSAAPMSTTFSSNPTTNVSGATPYASTYTAAAVSAPHVPSHSTAIPVQLPVASLPALHALGILPVQASSLPPADQPQPPAVLRGSTANGTMLSLEINVSLLQQAQMSGLAMVLNSLMSRGVSATSQAQTNGEAPSAAVGSSSKALDSSSSAQKG